MDGLAQGQPSMVGRLLEEISWEHARKYREGGRGIENVLTAEVLMALDFLPRAHFLGAVIQTAHGADEARRTLLAGVEEAQLSFLPGDLAIAPSRSGGSQTHVQPDALILGADTFVLVEAKRIRSSAFQPLQLAREFVAVMAHAAGRTPLILLLGVTPPVLVRGQGKMSISDAISVHLESVLADANNEQLVLVELLAKIDEVFCWISWEEVNEIVRQQAAAFESTDQSLRGSVQRLASSLHDAIAWHA